MEYLVQGTGHFNLSVQRQTDLSTYFWQEQLTNWLQWYTREYWNRHYSNIFITSRLKFVQNDILELHTMFPHEQGCFVASVLIETNFHCTDTNEEVVSHRSCESWLYSALSNSIFPDFDIWWNLWPWNIWLLMQWCPDLWLYWYSFSLWCQTHWAWIVYMYLLPSILKQSLS